MRKRDRHRRLDDLAKKENSGSSSDLVRVGFSLSN